MALVGTMSAAWFALPSWAWDSALDHTQPTVPSPSCQLHEAGIAHSGFRIEGFLGFSPSTLRAKCQGPAWVGVGLLAPCTPPHEAGDGVHARKRSSQLCCLMLIGSASAQAAAEQARGCCHLYPVCHKVWHMHCSYRPGHSYVLPPEVHMSSRCDCQSIPRVLTWQRMLLRGQGRHDRADPQRVLDGAQGLRAPVRSCQVSLIPLPHLQHLSDPNCLTLVRSHHL